MLYRLATLIHTFNFLDAVLTLAALRIGVEEANPLMAWLLSFGPVAFFVVKVVVVGVCVEYLDKNLEGSARSILRFILAAFVLVFCWHVFGLYALFTSGTSFPL